ncbi:MAG: LamG-like jellyroll fold domain-containing protein, partial [Bacteroidota bacterium]
LNPGSELTMEVWVRVHDSNWNQKIFGKLNPSFNSGYMMAVDQGKCYPEVWMPAHYDDLQGFVPPLGYWYHFAVTVNAGDSMNVYVNGVFEGGQSIGGSSIAANNDNLIIGIAPWDLQNFQYFGYIDEVRIWDNAKTRQEIFEGMHRHLSGSESGLLAYYNFNNANAPTSVPDESQNSNDCTFNNGSAANIMPSRAVIGDATAETMNDLHGLWNGNGFVNPRVSVTDDGLSLLDTITDWDYVVFGHDGGSGTTMSDLPAAAPASMERTTRVWYMNEVGQTTPNFNMDLDNASGGGTTLNTTFNAGDYYLLYRAGATGNFTILRSADTKSANTVVFENVDLETGYYALAATQDALAVTPGFQNSALLNLWPNPGQGTFHLQVEATVAPGAELQVFDVLGQRVHTQSFTEDISFRTQMLDLQDQPAGTYFVHLKAGEQVFTRQIQIQ